MPSSSTRGGVYLRSTEQYADGSQCTGDDRIVIKAQGQAAPMTRDRTERPNRHGDAAPRLTNVNLGW